MVLDELHVLERRASVEGQRHAVTVLDVGVGGERKDLAAATGADDHGFGKDGLNPARHQLDGDHAARLPVVNQQFGYEPFVVACDRLVFERGLEESVEHVEAGLVGGEPRALFFHSAERPHRNVAIRLAAPRAAPMLELHQLSGSFLDEEFNRILIGHPISAGDRVVSVLIQRVVGLDHPGGAAFG